MGREHRERPREERGADAGAAALRVDGDVLDVAESPADGLRYVRDDVAGDPPLRLGDEESGFPQKAVEGVVRPRLFERRVLDADDGEQVRPLGPADREFVVGLLGNPYRHVRW